MDDVIEGLLFLALILMVCAIISPAIFSHGSIVVDASDIEFVCLADDDEIHALEGDDGIPMDPLHVYEWKYSSDFFLASFPSMFGYKDTRVSLTIELDKVWYDDHRARQTFCGHFSDGAEELITVDDPYCIAIADAIYASTEGMSDRERIDLVLRFVQSFGYESDEDRYGAFDYWKYPAETLWEKRGDCEDLAILFVTLVRIMGYDAVVIPVEVSGPYLSGGHIGAGVVLDGVMGFSYTLEGTEYLYCETTAPYGLIPLGARLPFYIPLEWDWREAPERFGLS